MCIQVLQNRSVNPISIRRGRLCPPHPYSPRIFRPSTSSGPEQMINYLNESATRFYKTKDQSLLSIPQIDSKARTPFFLKNLQKVNKCIFSSFCVTSFAIYHKWYFVTKIVLNYCEKKLFLWSRKTFESWVWRPRICKHFDNERSEQFLVTECFFNLFLEVSHI